MMNCLGPPFLRPEVSFTVVHSRIEKCTFLKSFCVTNFLVSGICCKSVFAVLQHLPTWALFNKHFFSLYCFIATFYVKNNL